MIRECLKVVVEKMGEAGWGCVQLLKCLVELLTPGLCITLLLDLFVCWRLRGVAQPWTSLYTGWDGYRQSLWFLVGYQTSPQRCLAVDSSGSPSVKLVHVF